MNRPLFYLPFEQDWLNEGHDDIPNSYYDAHRLAERYQPPEEWEGWGTLVVVVNKGLVSSPELKEGTVAAREAT